MSDESPKKKPLSEIGHLFLSSVREQHLGGMPRPQRVPPQQARQAGVRVDLTPTEFARVLAASDESDAATPAPARRNAPVTAVIGEHLNGKQFARVKEYARHLSHTGNTRVGLIELDGSSFRLMTFEPGEMRGADSEAAGEARGAECFDARAMAEAIEEMNFDVDRWLLLIPSPRAPEAQSLLKLVEHWVLLSTCDHDGIVASYRMLKGVAELHRPRLSLAVLDAFDDAAADRVHKKLAGVCEQFLDRTLETETPVRGVGPVCEHLVMLCRPTRDKAQLGNPPQWGIVAEFLEKGRAEKSTTTVHAVERAVESTENDTPERVHVSDMVVPTAPAGAAEVMMPESKSTDVVTDVVTQPISPSGVGAATADGCTEVLDLPGGTDASAEQIVTAVLRQAGGAAMLECPVRPPMCADARLAVSRDREVVLLAVAKRGLSELNSIGQAYRWLVENRALIGMAVPQLAIDATRTPRLRLLVDQHDAGAEVLQPMLAGDHVAVQSYRRVKWGGKAGLLLEAA
jgi:hypothetical protein